MSLTECDEQSAPQRLCEARVCLCGTERDETAPQGLTQAVGTVMRVDACCVKNATDDFCVFEFNVLAEVRTGQLGCCRGVPPGSHVG